MHLQKANKQFINNNVSELKKNQSLALPTAREARHLWLKSVRPVPSRSFNTEAATVPNPCEISGYSWVMQKHWYQCAFNKCQLFVNSSTLKSPVAKYRRDSSVITKSQILRTVCL